MRILILDDDEDRHKKFAEWFNGLDVKHVYNLRSFIEAINSEKWDTVFLDHDLYDFVDLPDGGSRELTGKDAAKALCLLDLESRPSKVIVHSWNPSGAESMMSILKDAGFNPIRWVFDPSSYIYFS